MGADVQQHGQPISLVFTECAVSRALHFGTLYSAGSWVSSTVVPTQWRKVMESRAWLNIYPTDDSTVSVQTAASVFPQLEAPSTTHTD